MTLPQSYVQIPTHGTVNQYQFDSIKCQQYDNLSDFHANICVLLGNVCLFSLIPRWLIPIACIVRLPKIEIDSWSEATLATLGQRACRRALALSTDLN